MLNRRHRMLRGWVAACITTLLATSSHLLGGGSLPSPLILGFTLAISALICVFLANKLRSLPRLCTAVLLSQGIFHGIFSLSGDHNVTAVGSGHHNSNVTISVAADPSAHNSTPMLLVHLGAAVVTILILRYGEGLGLNVLQTLRLRLTRILGHSQRPPVASKIKTSLTFNHPIHWASPLAPLIQRYRGPPLSTV